MEFVINNFTSSEEVNPPGERELLNNANLKAYNEANEKKLNKIQFNKELRKEYREFIEEEILPYILK